jgi:hypothetical protein
MSLQILLIEIVPGPPPDIVIEFEGLMNTLDAHVCTREQWQRFQAILTEATLGSSNQEAGFEGYQRMLPHWRASIHFDGED